MDALADRNHRSNAGCPVLEWKRRQLEDEAVATMANREQSGKQAMLR